VVCWVCPIDRPVGINNGDNIMNLTPTRKRLAIAAVAESPERAAQEAAQDAALAAGTSTGSSTTTG